MQAITTEGLRTTVA